MNNLEFKNYLVYIEDDECPSKALEYSAYNYEDAAEQHIDNYLDNGGADDLANDGVADTSEIVIVTDKETGISKRVEVAMTQVIDVRYSTTGEILP